MTTHSWGDTDQRFEIEDFQGNGFGNRYYLAFTKHFEFKKIGIWGTHITLLYNKRSDYPQKGVAMGMNFRFTLPETNSSVNKIINGLNLMLEAHPADGRGTYRVGSYEGVKHFDRGLAIGKYDINFGACYSFWEDRINLYGELYGYKDFSGGLQFKVHLK